MNQGFIDPDVLLSLGAVDGLGRIDAAEGGELRLGAMATHRAVERAPATAAWPVLRRAFSLVASPRVRNVATVGGVLADADYASDPPAVLARSAPARSCGRRRGEREVGIGELIRGYYETCIAPDELLVEVRVPPQPEAAVYRKFRSRSSEDRPCVAVAAVRDGDALRVVVGAVAETPQHFPDVCALGAGARRRDRRRLRRADRADLRRARLGRVPAPGDRGRGAARGGGGGVIGVDPRVSGAQRYSVARRATRDAARGVRALAARPRARARGRRVGAARRLRGAPARGRRRSRALRLPGARPARARRRRAPRGRHRRRGRGADRARPRAPRRAAVDVSYEELPAVFDAVEAVAPGAPLLHPDAAESAGEAVSIGVRPLAGTNVCHRFRIRHGDAAAGFADADVVVSARSARRAPPTRRWSRTPRSPSGRTGG